MVLAEALPDLLRRLHAIPRWTGQGTGTNVFELNDMRYFQGVLVQGGAFWALAAIALVLFPAVYISGCCCCRDKSAAKASGTWCNRLGCAGVSYMLASLLLAVSAGLSLLYIGKFSNGGSDMISALKSFTGLLQNTSSLVETAALSSGAVATSSAAVYTGAVTLGAPQPVLDGMLGLQYAAGNISVGANTLYLALNDTIGKISEDLKVEGDGRITPDDVLHPPSGAVDVPAAKAGVYTVALTIAASALAWSVLSACVLSPTKVSACLFRTTSCLTILATVLTLVLTGVLYSVALVGSDVCADPNGSIVRLLNATTDGASSVASASVGYYAACGSTPGLPPAGVLEQTQAFAAGIAATGSAVDAVNASIAADPTLAPLAPAVFDMAGNLTRATAAGAALTVQLGCTPVNAVWATLVTALCDDAMLGVAQAFVALAIASGLLLTQLCCGARLNCKHPGDAPRPTREDQYQSAIEDLRAARVASMAATQPYMGRTGVVMGQAVSLTPLAVGSSYQGGPSAGAGGAKTWR